MVIKSKSGKQNKGTKKSGTKNKNSAATTSSKAIDQQKYNTMMAASSIRPDIVCRNFNDSYGIAKHGYIDKSYNGVAFSDHMGLLVTWYTNHSIGYPTTFTYQSMDAKTYTKAGITRAGFYVKDWLSKTGENMAIHVPGSQADEAHGELPEVEDSKYGFKAIYSKIIDTYRPGFLVFGECDPKSTMYSCISEFLRSKGYSPFNSTQKGVIGVNTMCIFSNANILTTFNINIWEVLSGSWNDDTKFTKDKYFGNHLRLRYLSPVTGQYEVILFVHIKNEIDESKANYEKIEALEKRIKEINTKTYNGIPQKVIAVVGDTNLKVKTLEPIKLNSTIKYKELINKKVYHSSRNVNGTNGQENFRYDRVYVLDNGYPENNMPANTFDKSYIGIGGCSTTYAPNDIARRSKIGLPSRNLTRLMNSTSSILPNNPLDMPKNTLASCAMGLLSYSSGLGPMTTAASTAISQFTFNRMFPALQEEKPDIKMG